MRSGLLNIFREAAGNGKAFLLGSVLTMYSGYSIDNPFVGLGGALLSCGAGLVMARKYTYVPFPSLVANIALAANGLLMMASGQHVAGGLLVLANGFFTEQPIFND